MTVTSLHMKSAACVLLVWVQTLMAIGETDCPSRCECSFGELLIVIKCDAKNLTSLPYLLGFEHDKKKRKVDLFINRNRIGYILWHSFFTLTGRLRVLEITGNEQKIEVASSAFDPFTDSLEILRLDPLSGDLNEELFLFSSLTSLVELTVSFRDQGGVTGQVLSSPIFRPGSKPRLKVLELSYCGLRDITRGVFDHLRLQTLNLGHNKFTEIPQTVTGLMAASLTSLSLGNNNIQVIKRDNIPRGCRLRSLDVSFNKLVTLEADTLAKCGQLQVVNLSYNTDLVSIGAAVLRGLMNLMIDLDHTGISRLDFVQPYQVSALKAAGVKIPCSCELQVRIRPLFGHALRGTCVSEGSGDHDISYLNLQCEKYLEQNMNLKKKGPGGSVEAAFNTVQPSHGPSRSLPLPVHATPTPSLSQVTAPKTGAEVPIPRTDVFDEMAGSVLPDLESRDFTLFESWQSQPAESYFQQVTRTLLPTASAASVQQLDSVSLPSAEAEEQVEQVEEGGHSSSSLSTESFVETPSLSREPNIEIPSISREPNIEPPSISREPNIEIPSFSREPDIGIPSFSIKPDIEIPSFSRKPDIEIPSFSRKLDKEIPSFSREPDIEIPSLSREPDIEIPSFSRKPDIEISSFSRKPDIEIPSFSTEPNTEVPAVSTKSNLEMPPHPTESHGEKPPASQPPEPSLQPPQPPEPLLHRPPQLPEPSVQTPQPPTSFVSPESQPSGITKSARPPQLSAYNEPRPPSPTSDPGSWPNTGSGVHSPPPPDDAVTSLEQIAQMLSRRLFSVEDYARPRCPNCHRRMKVHKKCRCRYKTITRQVRLGLKRREAVPDQSIKLWILNQPVIVLACFIHGCLTFVAFLKLEHGRLKP